MDSIHFLISIYQSLIRERIGILDECLGEVLSENDDERRRNYLREDDGSE